MRSRSALWVSVETMSGLSVFLACWAAASLVGCLGGIWANWAYPGWPLGRLWDGTLMFMVSLLFGFGLVPLLAFVVAACLLPVCLLVLMPLWTSRSYHPLLSSSKWALPLGMIVGWFYWEGLALLQPSFFTFEIRRQAFWTAQVGSGMGMSCAFALASWIKRKQDRAANVFG